jgi:hypothetical protein
MMVLCVCATTARAQGVGPNVVIPNARPHTNLQIMGTMQVPWSVSIHPATNYVAIGQCLPVYIDLLDASGKDIPRNPTGVRVSIADFDWTASGNAAVGKYDGPNAWAVCACPAAAVGSTIHVMATYPSRSMPEKSKVPGLAFQSYIELPVTPAHGTNSPAGCENVLQTTTVAIAVPGGGAPPTAIGGSARSPLATPAGGAGAAGGAAGAAGGGAPASGGAAAGGAPAGGAAQAGGNTPSGGGAPSAAGAASGGAASGGAATGGSASGGAAPGAAGAPQSGAGSAAGGAAGGASGAPAGGAAGAAPGAAGAAGASASGGSPAYVGQTYLPPAQLATTAPVRTPPPSGTAQPPSPPSGNTYMPGGAPVSTPPSSAPAPSPTSGRYKVTATGFRVLHQTKDDILSRDGHGDEIYGGFIILSYDRRTSKLTDNPNPRRTNVIGEAGFDGQTFGSFGDVNGVVPHGRIRGGTASAGGGFAQNDVFPAVADPSKTYGAAYTDNTFPFQLFNGTLTDGQDAIVILPSLWEADGYRDGFAKWVNNEAANAIQIWSDQGVQAAVAGTQLAVISPSGTLETSFGPHLSSGDQFGLAFAPVFGPLVLLNAGSYDRPIGVGASGVSGLGGIASGPVLPRRAIVITREIIEATLNKLATYNPATVAPAVFNIFGAPPVVLPVPPPGTLAIQLFESPANDLEGMYILYLNVERVATVVH